MALAALLTGTTAFAIAAFVVAARGSGDIEARLTSAGIPVQVLNENLVTILETWESLPALHAHLQAPHMADYRQKVKDMVLGMKLSVLSPA